MPQKYDFTFDRIIISFIIGIGAGYVVGEWIGNYLVWMTLGCAVSLGIETVTRTSQEMKKSRPPEQVHMPPKGFGSSRPPKPPKMV